MYSVNYTYRFDYLTFRLEKKVYEITLMLQALLVKRRRSETNRKTTGNNLRKQFQSHYFCILCSKRNDQDYNDMFSFLLSNVAWFCFVTERIVQAYSATELEGTPTEVKTQSVL